MCGGSKSETTTEATENVTETDYGAIEDADKVFADAQALDAEATETPTEQMETLLLVGGVVLAGLVILRGDK
ncbi:MAG: hypothetical protein WCA78_15705 [Rhizomicrobium sp.]